jgi:hypothetical protein
MSGIDQSNFPAFDYAAELLRNAGWSIVSPAELDDPETRDRVMRNLAPVQTWGDFLARDIKLIADGEIDGIVFLPNWYQSRGARLEALVGLLKSPAFRFWQWAGGTQCREIKREKVMDYIKVFTV